VRARRDDRSAAKRLLSEAAAAPPTPTSFLSPAAEALAAESGSPRYPRSRSGASVEAFKAPSRPDAESNDDPVPHLPFSAVSLGLIGKKTGPLGGADVLADALVEQTVALDARRFAESGEVDRVVSQRKNMHHRQGDQLVEDR
jgi:hypothetical protein